MESETILQGSIADYVIRKHVAQVRFIHCYLVVTLSRFWTQDFRVYICCCPMSGPMAIKQNQFGSYWFQGMYWSPRETTVKHPALTVYQKWVPKFATTPPPPQKKEKLPLSSWTSDLQSDALLHPPPLKWKPGSEKVSRGGSLGWAWGLAVWMSFSLRTTSQCKKFKKFGCDI